ncbi:MAG: protein-L-isoaspartate(D-aspartate) O-methyltransferase [Hoeflea sp.]|uniref:protein-L-isoaspartate(D-aspartate) O-methyltransferase n=1 Tax=Hoeflea sp. TaxID=1940281 RepID=UPI001D7F6BF6|nr:protein-L-isoaspartate(D-aspartate) O-methyltransferase [Hoeflea sp.]MBU4530706.1 protein-L-isoaspartate(D-aspartate) O-methyltransferase [Alphaproteobacteria bacterium]MBU4544926.1 protein-L-isoaspartate(D-aspartate) O-methyltransferase [Alphaproteobacteria bacterium]MBU4552069.1 protein-L-isoaspartate(D-aspartate) O-methyltransferase [Alphaproteobacteria bacterium]MBV1722258.1 protein-L-isoaspartate(D-aspartate) O-methyltransferase [Hoeflea sp.]MBV1761820.1 protein-L-isoaspartate(D-aspart
MNVRLLEKEGFAGLFLRLRAEGIADKALLTALEQTPRTLFVSAAHADAAYQDRLVPIDCGSFAESADLVARMIALLQIEPGHRFLDIGTGSGFLAAVAARLAERVVTIDRYKTLIQLAQQRFAHLGIGNVIARQADGLKGMNGEGGFDRIIATCAFDGMPRQFIDQLASGGVMLAPIKSESGRTQMARLTKIGSRFEREDLFDVPYLPFAPGLALAL